MEAFDWPAGYVGFAHELPMDDDRLNTFRDQVRSRGFDDTETWCLGTSFAKLAIPRLKRFREVCMGHPCDMTADEWDGALAAMQRAFEIVIADDEQVLSDEDWAEFDRGIALFAKHYLDLWW